METLTVNRSQEWLDTLALDGWEVHTVVPTTHDRRINVMFVRRVGPAYAGMEKDRVVGEHKISAQPVVGTQSSRVPGQPRVEW